MKVQTLTGDVEASCQTGRRVRLSKSLEKLEANRA